MVRGMNPKPRDFSCQTMMKNIPDGQLFWVIKNGSKGTGMMGFKMLSDDQIWQLVSYYKKTRKIKCKPSPMRIKMVNISQKILIASAVVNTAVTTLAFFYLVINGGVG